ncbi:MAG: DUF6314 family protein [Verrucomicrobiales bacterium]|nr:DUF6314 family protein [Verrucomicrobiota bacterium JB025]
MFREMESAETLNPQVFAFFEGEWSLQRSICGSYAGSFSGSARFSADPQNPRCLHYREAGKMNTADGGRFDSSQIYQFHLHHDRIGVLKNERSEWSAMHDLNFAAEHGLAVARHIHLCGADYYKVEYRVDFSGKFEVGYSVSGPAKDYSIQSTYSRAVG